jgi:hypothetical protein
MNVEHNSGPASVWSKVEGSLTAAITTPGNGPPTSGWKI